MGLMDTARCSLVHPVPSAYGVLASSAQVALKKVTHLAISGMELSQWYSYSTQNAPWKCWRLSSAIWALMLPTPVPQGTSCIALASLCFFFLPVAGAWACALGSLGTRSLKCRVMTRPSSFFRRSEEHTSELQSLRH